ncbi:hypothetical protein [Sphingomonas sp. PvP018]|uniref:hypothetical protein n=1 Tax=Sphingomonas sp. PvP018 TaxID=2817852 RepID=UPI001AE12602|nr:hypothetical protein [Sphingomonas sp. PvP018]MBP2513805.1 hypothetical protein [Sphingomonas sp. PvP018]
MSLASYLQAFTPNEAAMPLVHATSTTAGAQIIVSGEVRASRCPVYGPELAYFFYGRPAFKSFPRMPASGMDEHLPMCLVMDPALLGQSLRILPFDSGGYDRYSNHLSGMVQRADFELGPAGDFPLRLVRAFFETNRNYFHQRPTMAPGAIPVSQPAARAIARLAHDPSLAEDDDRRSTIEIQIDRTVPLATALRAVVGPPALLSDPEVESALDALPHVRRLEYETYGRHQPSAYTALLYDRVSRHLVDEGIMR